MSSVLIVEDDADSREALSLYLRQKGHQVEAVRNGKDALAAILTDMPDVVVLDLFLPEMDGPSLLEVVRSYLRLQSLPVIIMTALPDSPMVERARHLKVSTILVKGRASLEEVHRAVEEASSRLPT